jgi:precorrin-3B synthase
MSPPMIRGWCPGARRPMMSGDGLVVRLRTPFGRFSPEQAAGIADLSQRFGNGLLDLSARANLQIRGVTEAGHAGLIAGLEALGLVDPDPETEARRNIVVSPFWQKGDADHQITTALNSALLAQGAPQTPGKFGYAVDCGSMTLLRNISSDIRIERAEGGLICRADGADTGARVTAETAADTALDLAAWFLSSGGAPAGRGRMATHLARGVALPQKFREIRRVTDDPAPIRPDPTPQGQLVALEFGQITAASFASLARIAPIRLTPWRMLLLESISARPDLPGLIHDGTDPRLRIAVCTGAPGCPQGLSATRSLARSLAPHLPPGQHLHISGCAKGCAHPGPAALTLTAVTDGRFDLIRNGRAGDPPDDHALSQDALTKALTHAS